MWNLVRICTGVIPVQATGWRCGAYAYRSSSLSSLKTGPVPVPPEPWLGPVPPVVPVGNLGEGRGDRY